MDERRKELVEKLAALKFRDGDVDLHALTVTKKEFTERRAKEGSPRSRLPRGLLALLRSQLAEPFNDRIVGALASKAFRSTRRATCSGVGSGISALTASLPGQISIPYSGRRRSTTKARCSLAAT